MAVPRDVGTLTQALKRCHGELSAGREWERCPAVDDALRSRRAVAANAAVAQYRAHGADPVRFFELASCSQARAELPLLESLNGGIAAT